MQFQGEYGPLLYACHSPGPTSFHIVIPDCHIYTPCHTVQVYISQQRWPAEKIPCKYCNKEYSPRSLKSHETSCTSRRQKEIKEGEFAELAAQVIVDVWLKGMCQYVSARQICTRLIHFWIAYRVV